MKITQSKRTALIAKACKEFNDRFDKLLTKTGLHPYSKICKSKRESLIGDVSLKYGINKTNLGIILSK